MSDEDKTLKKIIDRVMYAGVLCFVSKFKQDSFRNILTDYLKDFIPKNYLLKSKLIEVIESLAEPSIGLNDLPAFHKIPSNKVADLLIAISKAKTKKYKSDLLTKIKDSNPIINHKEE